VKRLAILLLVGALLPTLAAADQLLMTRVTRPFPETMNALQDAVRNRGYTVSRVQRVDVGLSSSGFQTAEYRLVFYGKPDELRVLTRDNPDLIPYLPLNIVIFAEGDDSILLAANPLQLEQFLHKPALHKTFAGWEHDLLDIFDELTKTP